jgi:phage baseplate assembly protein W
MPIPFTLTTETLVTTLGDLEQDTNTEGEDIQCRGGQMYETDAGDLAVVLGVATTIQSIEREIPANPGSFPRRPEWGGGLNGMLFKGASLANRDRITTRALARLHANPRVQKVDEVSTTVDLDGTAVTIRAQSISGFIEDTIVIKPPGVS